MASGFGESLTGGMPALTRVVNETGAVSTVLAVPRVAVSGGRW